jgi:hypothetical protein
MKESVATRAKLHEPLGGQAPFGYIWKDKGLEPHPEEAPGGKLTSEVFF